MIQNKFNNINDKTDEGKLLLASLAILTMIDCDDINKNKFGGRVTPDDAFNRIQDLANKIYFEDEYILYLKSMEREDRINEIIK